VEIEGFGTLERIELKISEIIDKNQLGEGVGKLTFQESFEIYQSFQYQSQEFQLHFSY